MFSPLSQKEKNVKIGYFAKQFLEAFMVNLVYDGFDDVNNIEQLTKIAEIRNCIQDMSFPYQMAWDLMSRQVYFYTKSYALTNDERRLLMDMNNYKQPLEGVPIFMFPEIHLNDNKEYSDLAIVKDNGVGDMKLEDMQRLPPDAVIVSKSMVYGAIAKSLYKDVPGIQRQLKWQNRWKKTRIKLMKIKERWIHIRANIKYIRKRNKE